MRLHRYQHGSNRVFDAIRLVGQPLYIQWLTQTVFWLTPVSCVATKLHIRATGMHIFLRRNTSAMDHQPSAGTNARIVAGRISTGKVFTNIAKTVHIGTLILNRILKLHMRSLIQVPIAVIGRAWPKKHWLTLFGNWYPRLEIPATQHTWRTTSTSSNKPALTI